MIESVTIKWVTGSSKLKNNGETTIDGLEKVVSHLKRNMLS